MKTTIESNIAELAERMKTRKENIEKGILEGLNQTAVEGVKQEKVLHYPHSKTGKLLRSIKWVPTSKYSRAFGPYMDEKYSVYVEKGRGPVFAKHAKALRFEIKGQVFFRKSVGPATPRPFVAPTYRSMRVLFPRIMSKKISSALQS